MFGGGFGRGGGGTTFSATYRAFPLAFIDKQSAEYGDKVILPPSALDRLGACPPLKRWAFQEDFPLALSGEAKTACAFPSGDPRARPSPLHFSPNLTLPAYLSPPLPRTPTKSPTASLHIEYPMLFRVENAAAERASHCGVLEFVAEEGRAYLPRWVREEVPRLFRLEARAALSGGSGRACARLPLPILPPERGERGRFNAIKATTRAAPVFFLSFRLLTLP